MATRGRGLRRLCRLVGTLRVHGARSLPALASLMGVTTRTIRRDLDLLRDAGVGVYRDEQYRWRLTRSRCPMCHLDVGDEAPPAP
jgi:predicted DNA-binding transcriptional regulator YafY